MKCQDIKGIKMGGNQMTFYKEGKKISYTEIVKMLGTIIKEDMLSEFETEEVYNFFMRLFSFTENEIKNYLTEIGYQAISSKQAFFTASRLKIIPDVAVWNEALQVKESIKMNRNESIDKETLVKFITGPYYQAMQILKTNLENKQGQNKTH